MVKFKKDFYKETRSNWYPCYEIDYQGTLKLVRISCVELPSGSLGIIASGADDDDMGITLKSREEAEILVEKIVNKKYVDKDWLSSLGFEPG